MHEESLFDRRALFCPYDGQKLTESKWDWCGNQLLICSSKHVWEVTRPAWRSGVLEFDSIEMAKCECGQVVPKLLMKHAEFEPTTHRKNEGRKVCPNCFELIKKAWRPDLEKSHARLVITPIRRGDKVIFHYEEEVEISPYPNPYMCGGCWGGGTMTTEAEVEERIKDFTAGDAGYPFTADFYGLWMRLGVKFEVIRKPEMTAAEAINERQCDYIEEHPEEEATPEHAQMQLMA